MTRIAKIHRYSGYVMLLLGNFTVSSGIVNYFEFMLLGDSRKILGQVNLVTFFAFVIMFEAIYRLRNKYSRGKIVTPPVQAVDGASGKITSFSPEEIDKQVQAGKQLVVFDNLVLNLNGYERIHPGGKFTLTHNYGRDISKFFFGGYNLVQVKGLRPKHHSQSALDIVRTMVVGVIAGQESVQDQRFTISKKAMVNEGTATFTFQCEGASGDLNNSKVGLKPMTTNLKRWYNDPEMIGRHFLVFNDNSRRIKRQYTICSSIDS